MIVEEKLSIYKVILSNNLSLITVWLKKERQNMNLIISDSLIYQNVFMFPCKKGVPKAYRTK